jgi:hypothetical protein
MTSEKFLTMWGDLPSNSIEGVGKALLLPALRPELNGLAFFVHGDLITELEQTVGESIDIWMGPELAQRVKEGQRRILS